MEKVDSFFPLAKLSLQKASEVVTEKFVNGTCDFDDIFQIIPVDLHKDFIEAIGKYSISCLRKIFFTCPVAKRYHLERGDELHFSVLSQNSQLLLQLMLSGQGNCCLSIMRRCDEKLLKEFGWTVDAQCLKFLSNSAFESNSIWDTIPVSFLVCILKITRENKLSSLLE